MHVKRKNEKPESVELSKIFFGDVFCFPEAYIRGSLFMRIRGKDGVTAVRLRSGDLVDLRPETKVVPVSGGFVEE